MSLTFVIVALAKAAFVVIFGMSLAAALTWFDRRGGAMFQDRVGPERAVFFLPTRLAQALVSVPAILVAGGVIAYCWFSKAQEIQQTARAFSAAELKAALAHIHRADKELRDARPDDRTIMEQFVLGLKKG